MKFDTDELRNLASKDFSSREMVANDEIQVADKVVDLKYYEEETEHFLALL